MKLKLGLLLFRRDPVFLPRQISSRANSMNLSYNFRVGVRYRCQATCL